MFSALLDTCVLVPSRARDVLLEVASARVYRSLWSSEILAELDRTLRLLQGKRGMAPEETDAYLVRLFRQMETSFPDALVTGPQYVGQVQIRNGCDDTAGGIGDDAAPSAFAHPRQHGVRDGDDGDHHAREEPSPVLWPLSGRQSGRWPARHVHDDFDRPELPFHAWPRCGSVETSPVAPD